MFCCRIFVNLETKEKNYCGKGQHMCPRDGWVCFHNSELVSGRLGKATLGGGNKSGLFQVVPISQSLDIVAAQGGFPIFEMFVSCLPSVSLQRFMKKSSGTGVFCPCMADPDSGDAKSASYRILDPSCYDTESGTWLST